MTKRDLAKLVSSFPADAFALLVILRLFADEHGVVHESRDEIASFLDITKPTLNRRLKALVEARAAYERGNDGKIAVSPVPTGAESFVGTMHVDAVTLTQDVTAKDVTDRFARLYREKYDVTYRWTDFWAARGLAKKFVQRYGAQSLDIVDYVFANWDVLWRKPGYARPTHAATFGWIGDQAAEYLRKGAGAKNDEAGDGDVKEWI